MSKQDPPRDQKALLFFYTETPLHVGCGEGLGAIDLPLQRERISNLPVVPGSGAKGALREVFRRIESKHEEDLFGPAPPGPADSASTDKAPREPDHAGALTITDVRLLLLPIRTVYGGWAWATSPMLLERLARDLEIASLGPAPWSTLVPECSSTALLFKEKPAIAPTGDALILEDTLYKTKLAPAPAAAQLLKLLDQALPPCKSYDSIRKRLVDQLVILSDEELKHWAQHGMEVTTRVRIDDDTGAVAKGALWSEESLPAESLLWSLTIIGDSRKPRPKEEKDKVRPEPPKAPALMKDFGGTLESARIFLGGDRTIGHGLCGLRLMLGGT